MIWTIYLADEVIPGKRVRAELEMQEVPTRDMDMAGAHVNTASGDRIRLDRTVWLDGLPYSHGEIVDYD